TRQSPTILMRFMFLPPPGSSNHDSHLAWRPPGEAITKAHAQSPEDAPSGAVRDENVLDDWIQLPLFLVDLDDRHRQSNLLGQDAESARFFTFANREVLAFCPSKPSGFCLPPDATYFTISFDSILPAFTGLITEPVIACSITYG